MKVNTEQKFMKSAGGCKPFLILYLLFIAKLGFTAPFRCILFSLKDVACCGMICWIAQVASRVTKKKPSALWFKHLGLWYVIYVV